MTMESKYYKGIPIRESEVVMMIMGLVFGTLLGEGGGFRSKLLKAMDTVVVTPQKQGFIDNCQNPLM